MFKTLLKKVNFMLATVRKKKKTLSVSVIKKWKKEKKKDENYKLRMNKY